MAELSDYYFSIRDPISKIDLHDSSWSRIWCKTKLQYVYVSFEEEQTIEHHFETLLESNNDIGFGYLDLLERFTLKDDGFPSFLDVFLLHIKAPSQEKADVFYKELIDTYTKAREEKIESSAKKK